MRICNSLFTVAPLDVDGEVSQLTLDRQTLLRGIMQVQNKMFSKVSALVCMLHEATIDYTKLLTFETN